MECMGGAATEENIKQVERLQIESDGAFMRLAEAFAAPVVDWSSARRALAYARAVARIVDEVTKHSRRQAGGIA